MSATILDRTQAYHQNSTSRLLGRAQHHANLRSFTNRTCDEEDDGLARSSTPFIDYVRSNTNFVGTETEDKNMEQVQPFVCGQNVEPEGGQHQQNHKTKGLIANDVYLTDSRHSQVDPDYLSGRRMRDILAQKAFYTTSTQKLYGGVDWPSRIVPSPPLHEAGKQPRADMVTFRNESKRYEPRSEKWQKFGSRPFSWDYVQTRDGHHIPGPVQFCSPSRKILHIPGYMGHVTGGPGEMDNPRSLFAPQNKLQTSQPRYSDTGRKSNIPGYTGCVLYCDYQPACSNDPDHLRSTASRTYRPHDGVLCGGSPFKKTSAMSRMVTLTRPFNPFNKVY